MRVGIVGCGGIAQVHARVLNDLETVEFAACADIRFERAQKMAEAYGVTPYGSLSAMLDGEKLDAIHLCTPHYLHTPMLKEAADRGIAVFTEKPPVMTREDLALFAANAHRVPVGVCFQNRYNPNVRMLREVIADGRYGALRGVRAFITWDRGASYYLDSGWRGTWEMEGGGVLINQAVHTLDLLVYCFGKPDRVEGTMANHHLQGVIEVEDTVEARLTFGDRTALLYATTAYMDDAPSLVEFAFEKAVLRLENDRIEIRQNGQVETISFETDATLGKSYWGAGHAACIRDFYASIRENRPYQNGPDTVLDTMDAMLQLYEQNRR